jgi:hypothetical protein
MQITDITLMLRKLQQYKVQLNQELSNSADLYGIIVSLNCI